MLQPVAAVGLRHIAADDRPDRRVVHGFHHQRPAQPQVVFAWAEADPAGGFAVQVPDQARGEVTIGQRPPRLLGLLLPPPPPEPFPPARPAPVPPPAPP